MYVVPQGSEITTKCCPSSVVLGHSGLAAVSWIGGVTKTSRGLYEDFERPLRTNTEYRGSI